MRRDPALTFRGALKILGADDRPWLEALDRLLGGLLLGGFLVSGNESLLALFDPKGEARSLIRAAVARVDGWSTGLRRYELITAAHSVLVISSLFDALREELGPKRYARLALIKEEKLARVAGAEPDPAKTMLERLVDADIPMPYAVCGFHENLIHVQAFLERSARSTFEFLRGLQAWETLRLSEADVPALTWKVVDAAAELYKSGYVRLAEHVPEFKIWSDLHEHHATRESLQRLQDALSSIGRIDEGHEQRAVLASLNRAVVRQPLITTEPLDHIGHVTFPAIADSYVLPHFRLAVATRDAQPASEAWWGSVRPVRADLFQLLSAHFCSAASTRLPMLIFGHPGAGKSLLMKILAGWLPCEAYTVVRIPLRFVDAAAPVHRQIEQAIAADTHDRVSWGGLTAESSGAVRIILLDGLDELMQATGSPQTYYLDAISDFQRREAELGFPVAVVVTSRTVVVDRTQIPAGCPMVKLEEFDEGQIAQWLSTWQHANAGNEGARFRALTVKSALRHRNLAVHPLLLLMLALYAADPLAPDPGDEELTVAQLYGRLLDNFVRRELAKESRSAFGDIDRDAVADQLWRLGLTAFAMFNRGRQFVTDKELDRDFDGLIDDGHGVAAPSFDPPLTRAQQMVGRFFFIHASEARNRAAADRSTYEFLHPTFGEYLVAATVLDLLEELARQREAARRTQPDQAGGLLRSLISHRALAGRRPILDFAQQLYAIGRDRMADVNGMLDSLITQSTAGPLSRNDRYNPSGLDSLQRLAAYSANLALLRVALGGNLLLENLHPESYEPKQWRQSLVRLWRSGLDSADWTAVAGCLTGGRWGAWFAPRGPDAGQVPADLAEFEFLGEASRYSVWELGDAAESRLGADALARTFLALALASEQEQAAKERLYRRIGSAGEFQSTTRRRLRARILLRGLAEDAAWLPYELLVNLLRRCRRDLAFATEQGRAELARIIVARHEILGDLPELMRELGDETDRLRLLAAATILGAQQPVDAASGLAAHVHDTIEELRIGLGRHR